ncbi:MAG: hypothetical protein ABIT08_17265 [Bacteroidia bacterium]
MKKYNILLCLTGTILKGILFFAGGCSISTSVNAQKETYNWHFGNNNFISFVSGTPVVLPGCAINQNLQEGCSDMSDAAGNVLFYTDGSNVWNSNNTVMLNGSGLLGNYSSTQGALIVPKPGNVAQYYVFSLEDIGTTNNILRFSLVDMTLSGGSGDVVSSQKNIFVADSMTEKQVVVKHSNGIDYWLVTHKRTSDEFQCYLITPAGISAAPVSSYIGSAILHDDAVGGSFVHFRSFRQ